MKVPGFLVVPSRVDRDPVHVLLQAVVQAVLVGTHVTGQCPVQAVLVGTHVTGQCPVQAVLVIIHVTEQCPVQAVLIGTYICDMTVGSRCTDYPSRYASDMIAKRHDLRAVLLQISSGYIFLAQEKGPPCFPYHCSYIMYFYGIFYIP